MDEMNFLKYIFSRVTFFIILNYVSKFITMTGFSHLRLEAEHKSIKWETNNYGSISIHIIILVNSVYLRKFQIIRTGRIDYYSKDILFTTKLNGKLHATI